MIKEHFLLLFKVQSPLVDRLLELAVVHRRADRSGRSCPTKWIKLEEEQNCDINMPSAKTKIDPDNVSSLHLEFFICIINLRWEGLVYYDGSYVVEVLSDATAETAAGVEVGAAMAAVAAGALLFGAPNMSEVGAGVVDVTGVEATVGVPKALVMGEAAAVGLAPKENAME